MEGSVRPIALVQNPCPVTSDLETVQDFQAPVLGVYCQYINFVKPSSNHWHFINSHIFCTDLCLVGLTGSLETGALNAKSVT
jgi:hypothetical protein